VLPPCLLVAFSFQPAIADDLGWCKMSNRDQAIVACSRLPALNPKFADAYFNHRGIYCGMGDIANADQAIWLGAIAAPLTRAKAIMTVRSLTSTRC
jgi:hypothetical protein